jgi:hypothetical protein
VERLFGTAQDRWVKEMRLAGVRTIEQANALLATLVPEHNRRFTHEARRPTDAHRRLGPGHRLEAILSIQAERVVSNDYTVRFENRFYQLLKPVYAGERGGRVVIEQRLDGSMRIRFRGQYLNYREVSRADDDEFNALTADASANGTGATKPGRGPGGEPRPAGMQPAGGRSGRTPAEPYPPAGEGTDTSTRPRRPADNHPWREPFKPPK